MWWKLAGVWLTTALICLVLFLPVKTHTVKLDMPTGMNAATAEHVANAVVGMAGIVTILIALALLAIPIWLSWRIIRRHRKSN